MLYWNNPRVSIDYLKSIAVPSEMERALEERSYTNRLKKSMKKIGRDRWNEHNSVDIAPEGYGDDKFFPSREFLRDGHHRLTAADELGWNELDARYLNPTVSDYAQRIQSALRRKTATQDTVSSLADEINQARVHGEIDGVEQQKLLKVLNDEVRFHDSRYKELPVSNPLNQDEWNQLRAIKEYLKREKSSIGYNEFRAWKDEEKRLEKKSREYENPGEIAVVITAGVVTLLILYLTCQKHKACSCEGCSSCQKS